MNVARGPKENSLSQKWDVMTFLNAVYASFILIKKTLLAQVEIQILEAV
jgi:hypothetical protein